MRSQTHPARHKQFVAANLQLRAFLRKAEGLASWAETVNEEELRAIWGGLVELAPQVKDEPACETLDLELQEEIAAYVKNLRALQEAAETIRCVMLARRAELETAKRHLVGLQGWVHAYRQTV
jgi:hypothetical protein